MEVSNVLITLNSSTSTLVYLIFSSKYRAVLTAILRPSLRRPKPSTVNRVAMTTALAAHRAVELSLIPEEVVDRDRKRRDELLKDRRARLFRRSQTIPDNLRATVGKIPESESNLLLIDCLRSAGATSGGSGDESAGPLSAVERRPGSGRTRFQLAPVDHGSEAGRQQAPLLEFSENEDAEEARSHRRST